MTSSSVVNPWTAADSAIRLQLRNEFAMRFAAAQVQEQPSTPMTEPGPSPAPVLARPDMSGEAAANPSGVSYIGEGVPCDGDLVPCWRVQIESRGTWDAYNPTGCGGAGCFGPYQFSGEWAGKLGLPLDLTTTSHDQWVNAARELWAGGAGCSNWSACG